MASELVVSAATAYLTHIGAGNSFFTGTTEVNQGNIRAVVGANSPAEIYEDNVAMQWSGPTSVPAIPVNTETGQFAVINTLTAVNDLGADYVCRRNASIITTGGRIQQAISSNNGQPLANNARFCLYYPSEDFNQEVLVHDYTTTNATDVNQGNNISELLANITGRMNNFSGNNGPVCNGTLLNDLLDDNTSIFRKGCILTWETPATNGDAMIVAPGA